MTVPSSWLTTTLPSAASTDAEPCGPRAIELCWRHGCTPSPTSHTVSNAETGAVALPPTLAVALSLSSAHRRSTPTATAWKTMRTLSCGAMVRPATLTLWPDALHDEQLTGWPVPTSVRVSGGETPATI